MYFDILMYYTELYSDKQFFTVFCLYGKILHEWQGNTTALEEVYNLVWNQYFI